MALLAQNGQSPETGLFIDGRLRWEREQRPDQFVGIRAFLWAKLRNIVPLRVGYIQIAFAIDA